MAMIALAMAFKFFILSCGRRSGKTSSNLFLCIEEQGQHDGYYYMMHISTDHSKAKEMFEATLKVLGGPPSKHNKSTLVKRFRRNEGQDRWIETESMGPKNPGGKWYFFSGQYPNYEAIQGFMFPFHRLIIDEMQLQHPSLFTQVVVPMSSDGPGKVIMEGHPKSGRIGNYLFKRDFLRGKNPDWPNYASFNIPFEGNPYNDPEDGRIGRDACVTKLEEVEEWDGLFGDDEGALFEKVEETCSLPVLSDPAWYTELATRFPLRRAQAWFGAPVHRRRKYVVSADWAKDRVSKEYIEAVGKAKTGFYKVEKAMVILAQLDLQEDEKNHVEQHSNENIIFDEADESETSPAIDLGVHHRYHIKDWGKLVSDITYAPSLEDGDNYRVYQETALEIPLAASKVWKIRGSSEATC